ncbi:unnamed protein product [Rangifer tarandus platyrhynchus]|uniref:Uncharacterized protein n=2 Tax=Rangifer tarandus platyrhynchus TaxID=3082113 RepID=A0ABN8YLA2_RANTA|nr:unnamed protein product [Rangifer tarandus platyrhynchus]
MWLTVLTAEQTLLRSFQKHAIWSHHQPAEWEPLGAGHKPWVAILYQRELSDCKEEMKWLPAVPGRRTGEVCPGGSRDLGIMESEQDCGFMILLRNQDITNALVKQKCLD